MIKQLKLQRFLAMIYIGTAFGLVYFWWRFFSGGLFSDGELEQLIPHFRAYYQWETSFLLPDSILALMMLVSAILLWFDYSMARARLMAASCAGAALFLGILDLSYGFRSGLFEINHTYGGVVLESALSITAVGIVALVILFRLPSLEMPTSK